MKYFFIPQLPLLLLILNGNMIGMQRTTRFLAYKNHRTYSVPVNLDTKTHIEQNKDNSKERNNKDHENNQGSYIISLTHQDKDDKMAFYKKWQR